jgi:hypothetical protein
MIKSKKRHQKSIYFKDASLWDRIEKAAKDARRSVNDFIEIQLEDLLKAQK